MHKILWLSAFGWLSLGGTGHFFADVVSQYVRGKRAPGKETTLFYGLNTAYALGQITFGLLGLLVAQRAPDVLSQGMGMPLSLAAAACWLIFSFVFIEYWEPKAVAGVFGALVMAAAVAA